MLITTVINNYNYERFLPEAIDSAINQDYPNAEIIIVDDGSTDQSRRIIERYGSRVTAIYKDNGGHASTFNAGFAASKGDILCFLDSDDLFLPNKLSTIARVYASNPSAVLIYHQLQNVDAAKKPLGRPWPKGALRGDIRRLVEQSGGWWPRPTTSGLCASRAYLSKVLPMPCGPPYWFRMFGESYFAGLAPFFGPIIGIPEPLGLFRMHGNNDYNFRKGTRREEAERRVQQLTLEFDRLRASLHDRFGIESSMRLEDSLPIQCLRLAIDGSHSKLKVLMMALRAAVLPASAKLRTAAKIILNRDFS